MYTNLLFPESGVPIPEGLCYVHEGFTSQLLSARVNTVVRLWPFSLIYVCANLPRRRRRSDMCGVHIYADSLRPDDKDTKRHIVYRMLKAAEPGISLGFKEITWTKDAFFQLLTKEDQPQFVDQRLLLCGFGPGADHALSEAAKTAQGAFRRRNRLMKVFGFRKGV